MATATPIDGNLILKGGSSIEKLRPEVVASLPTAEFFGVMFAYDSDMYFWNGTKPISMSGFKSSALAADDGTNGLISVLNGLVDGTYQFRSIKKGSSKLSVTKDASNNIVIDLGSVGMSDISGLVDALAGKEPAFTKETAFNKPFGTSAGTVTEGNDSRLSDARTPTAHNQPSNSINVLTGYGIGSTDIALTAADSLNDALGKLEYLARVKNISDVSYNSTTQAIEFKSKSGATIATVDLPLESVLQDIDYNSTTKILTFTLVSGATTDIALSDLIDIYQGSDANGMTVTIAGNVISVSINDGSIAKTKLTSALQTEITNKAENTQTLIAASATDTQVGAGAKTINSILQWLANNIASLFAKHESLPLTKSQDFAITGTGGTITAATHGFTSIIDVRYKVNGVFGILPIEIGASNEIIWFSNTNLQAGNNAVLRVTGK